MKSKGVLQVPIASATGPAKPSLPLLGSKPHGMDSLYMEGNLLITFRQGR
jgi:hypothetical protein